MRTPGLVRLSRRRARKMVLEALSSAGPPAPIELGGLIDARPDLIRRLPNWVGRYGWLESEGVFFLWCEPVEAAEKAFSSQIILDLPAGRYFVEALDADAGAWISRESCAGGPLVAGLPFTGGPILVLIRRFSV